MKVTTDQRLPTDPALMARRLTDLLNDVAQQLNQLTEGRVSAIHTARTAAPTTGLWKAGDFVRNANPVDSGGSAIYGWLCVLSGEPGTWQEINTGAGGGGGGSWGGITGTLSDQTDLQTALDGKAPLVHTHAGIPVTGAAVVTVPASSYEHEETVTATGLASGMEVLLSIAPHSVTDENHETLLEIDAMTGEPKTNTLTVRIAFSTPTSGQIRINYMAA